MSIFGNVVYKNEVGGSIRLVYETVLIITSRQRMLRACSKVCLTHHAQLMG